MDFSPRVSRNRSRLVRVLAPLGPLFIVLFLYYAHPPAAHAAIDCQGDVCTCNGAELMPGEDHHDKDLKITGKCEVKQSGVYSFRNVNIYSESPNLDPDFDSECKGPALIFEEGGASGQGGAKVNFWAEAILVENNGCLKAGSPGAPFGTNGGGLTVHLYGKDQNKAQPFDVKNKGNEGVVCKTQRDPMTPPGNPTDDQVGPCGIPWQKWQDNGESPDLALPGGVHDRFYQYGSLPYDDGPPEAQPYEKGFFGRKVLAVSYGGTLELFGRKAATYDDLEPDRSFKDPTDSGTSWTRLNETVKPGDPGSNKLVLDRMVDTWEAGDQIVVTTTDYLPVHSEQREIGGVTEIGDHSEITLTEAVEYIHNGHTYKLRGENSKNVPDTVGPEYNEVETRAAVANLTRDIRIVSAGDEFSDGFPVATVAGTPPCKFYCFGGHMIFRQGVLRFQVQGVEFYQMGQGGRIGHYPIHAHVAREVPNLDTTDPGKETFVKDSSVHDSMTRFFVLHGVQKAIMARNVGYKSIGHGFYLEDGTETDNKLYSNLGILARAALQDGVGVDAQPQKQNPRMVPGILASTNTTNLGFPQASDYINPSVFWFTNAWNEFIGNMAVGATACGAPYWNVNTAISGPSASQQWKGYANIKPTIARAATAPLKKFYQNYGSTAQWSYSAVGPLAPCFGVDLGSAKLDRVPNSLLPALKDINSEGYYPRSTGEVPQPTHCRVTGENPEDCSTVDSCGPTNPEGKTDLDRCMPTILDRYTSSFHWAEGNFSAIWLRHAFFVLMNSALTDVQGGGVSFVTGGSYTESDTPPGNIMLGTHNVFVGETQPDNPFASDAGPFNPETKASVVCAKNGQAIITNYCLDKDQGISMPTGTDFMNFQRFVNIYDGPFYQDGSVFLDIKRSPLGDCKPPLGQCSIRLNECTADSECTKICSENSSANCETDAFCVDNKWGTCESLQKCNEPDSNNCFNSEFMWGRTTGIRYNPDAGPEEQCYLSNAAIAWKQQNGFYYPPVFSSKNLYFDNVDIRHYVVEPLFKPEKTGAEPFRTDVKATRDNYCTFNNASFQNFTAIDRQTVLNDDDGSLTGLFAEAPRCEFQKQVCVDDNSCPEVCSKDHALTCENNNQCGDDGPCIAQGCTNEVIDTISVNQDSFFNAPVETFECDSDDLWDGMTKIQGTAKTSPYEHVTTAVYPGCALTPPGCDGDPRSPAPKCECLTQGNVWAQACSNASTPDTACSGVPLYRQYLTGTEAEEEKEEPDSTAESRKIRMMGPAIFSRLNLTANNGLYYIDTTNGKNLQKKFPNKTVFEKNKKYYVFLLFARPSTEQTYQFFVGEGKFNKETDLTAEFANIAKAQPNFEQMGWPAGWTRCYGTNDMDDKCKDTNQRRRPGILEVTMNMSAFASNFEAARADNCTPGTLCEFKGNKCKCKDDSEFSAECKQRDICSWSGRGIDCPVFDGEARCMGFAVKLGDNFKTTDDDEYLNPRPRVPQGDKKDKAIEAFCFPDNGKWDVMFTRNTDSGACSDTPVGMTNFCGMGAFPSAAVGGGASVLNGNLTREEAIVALRGDLQMLVERGKLAPRHANSPSKQLAKALKKIAKGKSPCQPLRKFVKKMEKRIRKGKLAEEDGDPLIQEADMIRVELSCSA